MKKFNGLALTFYSILLTGCASVPLVTNYQPNISSSNSPPIGKLTTVSIGEEMLKQGYVATYDAITVKKGSVVAGYAFNGSDAENTFKKIGENERFNYYKVGLIPNIRKDTPVGTLVIPKASGEVCIIQHLTGLPVCNYGAVDAFQYSLTTIEEFRDDRLQQVLYYNGRVGNKINIGYREFLGGMARPAFNNDVEYDLNGSKTIAYKGAVLEIVKASNQSISYKVVNNFK